LGRRLVASNATAGKRRICRQISGKVGFFTP
jgi:hypothetical protein